jgi:hypothetical protein
MPSFQAVLYTLDLRAVGRFSYDAGEDILPSAMDLARLSRSRSSGTTHRVAAQRQFPPNHDSIVQGLTTA